MGMENAVRFLISRYSLMIWDLVRSQLEANGMGPALAYLDPVGRDLITEGLVFVACKILSAVSDRVNGNAFTRNTTCYFRRLMGRGNPPQEFLV